MANPVIQQINLYNCIPKQQRFYLTPNFMLQICVAFLILLLLYSGYLEMVNLWDNNRLSSYQQQAKTSAAQLEKAKENAVKMVNQNKLLQDWLASNTQLLQKSAASKLNNAHGIYVQLFTILSTQIVPDVWLKSISINVNAKTITLTGSTLSIGALVQFLENLNHHSNIFNKQFKITKMSSLQVDTGGAADFTLEVLKP